MSIGSSEMMGIIKDERPKEKIEVKKELKLAALINRECFIKPLEIKGVIIGIYITKKGAEYQVRYYFNGEQKSDYFFDWEIEI